MKIRKSIICFGLAVLLLVPSVKAGAATHAPGCSATLKRVACTSTRVAVASEGSHILYTTPNGTRVTCAIKSEIFLHNIYCANSSCNAVYVANEARKCRRYHTYCPEENGLCQY